MESVETKIRPEIDRVRDLFDYDPETGILTNKQTGIEYQGDTIHFDGFHLQKTHVIWACYHGTWPKNMIDHKDRYRTHNWISNLREATTQQNGYNMLRSNDSGYKGIYNCGRKSKPWQAQIRINGKKVNLGRFATKEEAAQAYHKAAKENHGEFARTLRGKND